MFSSINKTRLVAAAKFLVAATKNLFVVPNFVAATKPFFSVGTKLNLKKNKEKEASWRCIHFGHHAGTRNQVK